MQPNLLDEPLLVSESVAAKLLGVSERTLFTMRQRGEIPYVPVRGRNLYSVDRLRVWIRTNEKTRAVQGASRTGPVQKGALASLSCDAAGGSG